ncbi:hypothetical protein ACQ4PT_000242 [Festuca glaucescens]
MAAYGIYMAQLHPRAVVTLVAFQHLCESFVGVMPSVALFRHYFVPRVVDAMALAEGVDFSLRDEVASKYLTEDLYDRWGEWRRNWCFVRFLERLDQFEYPVSQAVASASWELPGSRDDELAPIIERIKNLRLCGLIVRQVILNFLQERVAPLHQRLHAMWVYEGPSDAIRLHPGGPLGRELLDRQVKFICGGGAAVELPPRVRPLWADDDRDAIIASLPDCNEWWIEDHWKPPGEFGAPVSVTGTGGILPWGGPHGRLLRGAVGGSSPWEVAANEGVEDATASSPEPPPMPASRKRNLGESSLILTPEDPSWPGMSSSFKKGRWSWAGDYASDETPPKVPTVSLAASSARTAVEVGLSVSSGGGGIPGLGALPEAALSPGPAREPAEALAPSVALPLTANPVNDVGLQPLTGAHELGPVLGPLLGGAVAPPQLEADLHAWAQALVEKERILERHERDMSFLEDLHERLAEDEARIDAKQAILDGESSHLEFCENSAHAAKAKLQATLMLILER